MTKQDGLPKKPRVVRKQVEQKASAAPVGRPSSYRPEYAEQARKFALLGATNARMAELFDVSGSTFDLWMKDIPEFSGALKAGKELADANIANSLYHRALGYSHPEDDIRALNGEIVITPTIKHYPPDTGAATLWLKNRQPHTWRDKVEVDSNTTVTHLFDSEQAERMAQVLASRKK